MAFNNIRLSTELTQITPSTNEVAPLISQGDMTIRIIELMQGFCFILLIVGLVVGIIYMVKSKKTKGKKFLIGTIIIVVPIIISWIISIVKFNMLLNM